jgi:hypothetical protein
MVLPVLAFGLRVGLDCVMLCCVIPVISTLLEERGASRSRSETNSNGND